MTTRLKIAFGVALLGIAAALLWLFLQDKTILTDLPDQPNQEIVDVENRDLRTGPNVEAVSSPDLLKAEKPADSETQEENGPEEDPEKTVIKNPWGDTPVVSPDATPQVKSLVSIVKSGENLGRLSAVGNVPAFDSERYRNDDAYRKKYLEEPIGARVFAPAQPNEGVPHIQRSSSRYVRLIQGEVALLKVKSVPRMPVTFTSFDLGRFKESQLTTLTVEAGEDGFAVATFESPPGSAGDINVVAASPVATGQVRFLVNINLPESALGGLQP